VISLFLPPHRYTTIYIPSYHPNHPTLANVWQVVVDTDFLDFHQHPILGKVFSHLLQQAEIALSLYFILSLVLDGTKQRFKNQIKQYKTYSGADINSDHNLVMMEIQLNSKEK
jgi:hypothetical protein